MYSLVSCKPELIYSCTRLELHRLSRISQACKMITTNNGPWPTVAKMQKMRDDACVLAAAASIFASTRRKVERKSDAKLCQMMTQKCGWR